MEWKDFTEQYSKYRWFYLLENPQIRDFVRSYNNEHTRRLVSKSIYIFDKEVKKDNPSFDISELFELSPTAARKLIWRIVQRIMDTRGKSNITAKQVKSYVSILYNETNEESGKVVTWKRKHRLPVIRVRKKKVPTHEEVWRLIDFSTHIRDKAMICLSYSTGLKAEALSNLNVSDLKPILEDFERNPREPLILPITSRIYPKRFTSNGNVDLHHSLICKDCATLLLQYYREKRSNAEDSEPFFITNRGKRLGIARFSNQIEYLRAKLDKQLGGDRTNVRASLLRDAFYNRLVSSGMQDQYRETLMMHTSIRSHYFNWELERDKIIEEYNKANFNRSSENNEVRRKVTEQETELEALRKKVAELEKLTAVLEKYDVRELLKSSQKIKVEES